MNDYSINIRLAEESDRQRWDEFVLSHPNASPYHLLAWKKAIETGYKHKCHYLIAEKHNKIVGILPLVQLRLFPFINEMVALPFCDVGSCISVDAQIEDSLCKEAIQLNIIKKTKNIQLRGDLAPTETIQSQFKAIDTDKVRMFLNLPSSPEELLASFKSKLRSQVRKAEKNGVVFEWGGLEDIDGAYHVFSKNMHELGSPVHSKLFLKAVLENYGNRAKLGLATFEGRIIGMGIILLGGKCVSIPWASTLREYNRLGPNMLLYWNFLKYSADNRFAYFDFGRSTEGEGTYKFKKQWGAKPIPLVWYELNDNDRKRKDKINTGEGIDKRELAAELWRKMPLKLANIIGPHIRKYISL
ncbi:FemAB family XrtA/PEP-CTERM system-associated protein [Desulfosarcina ovata]|uniref:BioF2-like acetyltransferase domain-containing protein n=1 Tax=Desulfosarcina ovata subsp. ovata TaxID=2752305 RepID=A0A5K8A7P4_9BACT|nr:FemAB family XrtA/PEP-CTERM system-associated protein [Desulfosarcina ovata]BBO88547.1 hypothetical protein DSCOOX_17270 [Desulfosarcina ovata subsp. ovata]